MGDDIRKLDPVIKSLPCKLTQDELLICGNDLASVIQDIKMEEDEQVNIKSEMKARLTELESRKTQLAIKLTRKEEWRPVEIERKLDFEDGKYREIRADTGEVIFEREISDDECQEKLIIDDAGPLVETENKPAEEPA